MIRVLGAALLMLLSSACAPPDATTLLPADDGRAWSMGPAGHFVLPEARQGRRDALPPDVDRPIWNVLANGDVSVRGIRWPVTSPDPVEVSAALAYLRNEGSRSPDDRGRREGRRRRLGLHAHRAAPWRAVLELLHVARDDRVGLDAVDVFVRLPARPRDDEVLSARLVAINAEDAPRAGTELTFVVREVTTPPHVQIRVDTHPGEVGRWPEAYDFYPGSRLLPRERNESILDAVRWFDWVNDTWRQVEEALADARSPASIRVLGPAAQRHVAHPAYRARGVIHEDPRDAPPLPPLPPAPPRVDPEQELAFAYVVTALDLLLARGIRTVAFPDEGFALELDPRHVEPPPPEPPLRRPPTATETLIALGAAALAVLVAWAGMRKISRRDRRGRARRAR